MMTLEKKILNKILNNLQWRSYEWHSHCSLQAISFRRLLGLTFYSLQKLQRCVRINVDILTHPFLMHFFSVIVRRTGYTSWLVC